MFSWTRVNTAQQQRIYLDHAAATPLRPEIQSAMDTVANEYANASAIHAEGVAVRQRIETARTKLARCLKVRPEGVTFTGSGTESNNLALLGTLYELQKAGRSYRDMEVISTKLEHPSVSAALEFASSLGVSVTYVDVTKEGLIETSALERALTPKTVLVSSAYINSEIGVIQPLGKLARVLRKYEVAQGTRVILHADAAQAPYWEPCQFDKLPVDLLSLDAAKAGGPKGVGVLVRRYGVVVAPVLYGGPQEAGLRPATENTAGIIGGVEAIVTAQADCQARSGIVSARRDEFLKSLLELPDVVLNGDREHRVANNINVSVLGLDSEFLTISLDAAGVAASTKSACSGASGGGSEVVRVISGSEARSMSTLRLTLGPSTSIRDIAQATERILAVVRRLREQTATV